MAEVYLNQAEIDFADGTFAPFWDSVEKAAQALGRFDERVRQINSNASHYAKLVEQYEEAPPAFPLHVQSVEKLAVAKATAERMKRIVRNAQSNFQFAMIFEQRKTNQILVAGFTNLAQALEQMTWRITASIGGLTSAVDAMGSTLNESVLEIDSQMRENAKATAHYREVLSREASERTVREEKVVELLDNIQRGRRPFP